MRALVQRVSHAAVLVDGQEVGRIGVGLVVFLGVGRQDSETDARYLVAKVANLRIFPDDEGRFSSSALDIGAELLLVSQFTLYAGTRKGKRPSFVDAASPEQAQPIMEQAVEAFRQTGLRVETGRFQEHMQVEIHNDGPVTIWLDSADMYRPRLD